MYNNAMGEYWVLIMPNVLCYSKKYLVSERAYSSTITQ